MLNLVLAGLLFGPHVGGIESLCPSVSTSYKSLVCDDHKEHPPKGRKNSNGKDKPAPEGRHKP